jgi:ADP-ribosylglycohydrolase
MEKEKNDIPQIIEICRKKSEKYIDIIKDIFSDPKFSFSHIPLKFPKDYLNNFYSHKKLISSKINSIDKENNKDLYNCLSCIYGAFLGDALGSYCEFKKKNESNCLKIFNSKNIFGKSAGTITDDSEMAMSIAYSIFDLPDLKNLNSTYIYFYYQMWLESKPFDIGNTISVALKSGKMENLETNYFDKIKDIIKNKNSKSKANGFLMRISPIIVWFYYINKNEVNEIIKGKQKEKYDYLYKKIRNIIIIDNMITHPNIENNLASGLFIFMALSAIVKNTPEDIINQLKILLTLDDFTKDLNGKEISKHIKKCFKDIKDNKFKYDFTLQAGYYMHSIRLIIYYLNKFNDIKDNDKYTKYRTIINEICNEGGDTDTNAAIVGTIIGPLIGYSNFGKDFQVMIDLKRQSRIQFSPFIMYNYVKYIEDNCKLIEEGKYEIDMKPRYNTLKKFLEMLLKV